MAFELQPVRDLVKAMVQDDARFVSSPNETDLLIEGAVRQLNKDKPFTKVVDIPGDGTQDYDLGTDFEKGFSRIISVEHPALQIPPTFKRFDDDIIDPPYEDVFKPAGQQIRLKLKLSTPQVLSTRLTALDVESILFQTGNTIRYTFNTTPDLSAVEVGDTLVVTLASNALNNGTFFIVTINDASDFVEVLNPDRSDNVADKASASPATANVDDVEIIRVRMTTKHTLTLKDSTLTNTEFQAVGHLSTSLYFKGIGGRFAQSQDSTIDADSVDYQGRTQNVLFLAERHRTDYNRLVGLDEKVKPAQALSEQDVIFTHGEDMLFHPVRTR